MEEVFKRLAPSCAMVLTKNPSTQSVDFLGSAFAVRQDGYLFTAADVVKDSTELLISPTEDPAGFQPTSREQLRCFGARLVSVDTKHNVALLKLGDSAKLSLPPDLLGESEGLQPGAELMYLGFPFGRHGSMALTARAGLLAAKVQNPDGVRNLLVEGVAYSGSAGGPLIDVRRGRIVGVLLTPLALLPKTAPQPGGKFAMPSQTDLSIAAPIEAATALLRAAV